MSQLRIYPKLGALWEGFALEQIIQWYRAVPEECFFWATHGGAELDLLIMKNGKRIGFEFKYADAPKVTASMHSALNDLNLDHLYIINPGNNVFPMREKITARGLESFLVRKIDL